jgi:hypothetical protein
MKPEDCPKYERCNANICPMDEKWRKRRHLSGEPACQWLREIGKEGGLARVGRFLLEEQVQVVHSTYLELTSSSALPQLGHSMLRKVLLESSKSGSVLDRGNRLK